MSLTIGQSYVKATKHPFQGKIYYETGELRYQGGCVQPAGQESLEFCGSGTEYYKSGTVKRQGLFQRRGLVCGRMYYPSGRLRFEGYFAEPTGYGPVFPTSGAFYGEDGSLLYQGTFQCRFSGIGYPTVIVPENFGSLA